MARGEGGRQKTAHTAHIRRRFDQVLDVPPAPLAPIQVHQASADLNLPRWRMVLTAGIHLMNGGLIDPDHFPGIENSAKLVELFVYQRRRIAHRSLTQTTCFYFANSSYWRNASQVSKDRNWMPSVASLNHTLPPFAFARRRPCSMAWDAVPEQSCLSELRRTNT